MYSAIFILLFILFLLILGGAFALLHDHVRHQKIAYDRPDFRDLAGFRIISVPESDIITYKGSYLSDRVLAQLEFVVDPGWPILLRAARSGMSLNLEDFSANYDEVRICYFDGIRTVVQQIAGEASLCLWSRDGFDFCLYMPDTEMGLTGGIIPSFVTDVRASNR